MNILIQTLGNIKQWILCVVTTRFNNTKEPKLLKKSYEVTCQCGAKYTENYEPSKKYLPCCDKCLPF